MSGGSEFQPKGTASAKALRPEYNSYVEKVWRPMLLKQGEQGKREDDVKETKEAGRYLSEPDLCRSTYGLLGVQWKRGELNMVGSYCSNPGGRCWWLGPGATN
jgi:hypothetical protein